MAKYSETDLADLATRVQALNSQPNQVSAVSVKLPDFWAKSPEVWFARVEAQFGTKGINQDQTKYDYVVSALDMNTAEEVQPVLLNPPLTNRYDALKKTLVKTFGRSQVMKDIELLNLQGLGDKRPTALLRKIEALNDDPGTLKRALFLVNLPSDIRSILAGHDFPDINALANAADRIWEARMAAAVQQVSVDPPINQGVAMTPNIDQSAVMTSSVQAVSGARRTWKNPSTSQRDFSSSTIVPAVCFYHLKFGPEARRCRPGCKFASLLQSHKQPASPAGNATAGC